MVIQRIIGCNSAFCLIHTTKSRLFFLSSVQKGLAMKLLEIRSNFEGKESPRWHVFDESMARFEIQKEHVGEI